MKFYVHKLGCPKNDVDADYITARLVAAGHEPVANPEEAESIIVNTCGFILPAKEESINELLRFGQLKKTAHLKKLYASGCLSQRYGDELLSDMPELDGAFGLGALDSLAQAVDGKKTPHKTIKMDSRKLAYLSWKHRFISDDFPYAYLKISDGCDRMCSYCAIPSIRGHFRSRPLDSILNEAQFLAENGKKELILVSQEATLWGYDLPGKPTIVNLLQELETVTDIAWIRLLYLYPSAVSPGLVEYLADSNKTVNYFDLPLQHINNDILKAMRRQTDRETTERLLEKIRARSDNAVVRTTFIVGFPGETEEQFEELCDFVRDFRFERMGVFTYSKEDGTAAAELASHVPQEVMAERMDTLMTIQRDIAFEYNNSLIGSTMDVIIDSVMDEGVGVGRTYGDCPEVDPVVYVHAENITVGEICRVRIDAVEEYDIRGSKLEG